MGKIGLIVQARLGSTRLPRKSLLPLAGEPLVGRILERLKRVTTINELILAIPEADKELEDLGKNYDVQVFKGSENDLLDRYYQAAKQYCLETILRIPADNVAPEPSAIDKMVRFYLDNDFDFCSNLSEVFNNGYPDGIGTEILSFRILERAWNSEKDLEKREHVHLNFLNYSTQTAAPDIRVATIKCPIEFARPDVVLDVNTHEQYQKMNQMYTDLYPRNPEFSIMEVIEWWDTQI